MQGHATVLGRLYLLATDHPTILVDRDRNVDVLVGIDTHDGRPWHTDWSSVPP
jgi:hypothetical protein